MIWYKLRLKEQGLDMDSFDLIFNTKFMYQALTISNRLLYYLLGQTLNDLKGD